MQNYKQDIDTSLVAHASPSVFPFFFPLGVPDSLKADVEGRSAAQKLGKCPKMENNG